MPSHPDFAHEPFPRHAQLGPFRLEILSPDCLEEDFEAVVASEAILVGLFDETWPKGLTLEENRKDLARHLQEFDENSAFAWAIRSSEGVYLGCAYVVPTPGKRREAKVYTWIRARNDRLALLAQFNALFGGWLDPFLTEGFALDWATNDW